MELRRDSFVAILRFLEMGKDWEVKYVIHDMDWPYWGVYKYEYFSNEISANEWAERQKSLCTRRGIFSYAVRKQR